MPHERECNIFTVYNPYSAQKVDKSVVVGTNTAFHEGGYNILPSTTLDSPQALVSFYASLKQGIESVAGYTDPTVVLIFGGDGTVNLAVRAASEIYGDNLAKKLFFAHVICGECNVNHPFYGIPADTHRIISTINQFQTMVVDRLKINFATETNDKGWDIALIGTGVNGVATGLEIYNENRSALTKNKQLINIVRVMLPQLHRFNLVHARIDVGQMQFEDNFAFLEAINSPYYGDSLHLTNRRLDDGLLSLVWSTANTRYGALVKTLIGVILADMGIREKNPLLRQKAASQVSMEFPKTGVIWQVDGDPKDEQVQKLQVEVVNPVRFVVMP
jgi:diacylglycerol kinase family enzyme